jgi:hypothetical protein
MHWVSTTIFKIIGDSYSLSCDSIYTQRIECSLNSRPLLLDISHLYNTYARQVENQIRWTDLNQISIGPRGRVPGVLCSSRQLQVLGSMKLWSRVAFSH